MSLIADALRAAQREKDRNSSLAAPPGRPVVDGFFRVARPRRGDRRRLLLTAAGSAVAVVALLFSAWLLPGRASQGSGAATTAAASRAAPAAPAAFESLDIRHGPEPLEPETDAADAAQRPASSSVPPVTWSRGPQAQPVPGAGSRRSGPMPEAGASPRGVQPGQEASASGVRMSVEPATSASFRELFAAALAAQNRGDVVQARDLYEQILVLRPEWAQAHNNLGTVRRSLGDVAGAEQSFRRAVSLEDMAAAWSNLGMLLSSTGRAAEALSALRHALRLEPQSVATRVNLANVLHGTGGLAEARGLLEEAATAAPTMPEVHYGLGRILEDLQQIDGAVRHYRLFLSHAGGRFPQLEERVRSRVDALSKGPD